MYVEGISVIKKAEYFKSDTLNIVTCPLSISHMYLVAICKRARVMISL